MATDDIPRSAYYNADIDFSGFRAMLKDMDLYPKKLKRQFVRKAMSNIKRILTAEERRQSASFALSQGQISKWGRQHTGAFRKSIKGRVVFGRYDSIYLFAGVRLGNADKAKYEHIVPPTTYGGIWLNFGTKAHKTKRSSQTLTGIWLNFGTKAHKTKRSSQTLTAGTQQADWVMRTYNNTKTQIQGYIDSDCKTAFEQTLANVYKPTHN